MQSTAVPNDDEINEEHIQEERDFAQTKAQKKRFNSRDGNRTAHLDALYDWLPDEIRHAPNIEWANIPSNVIGYLVQTVGTSPEAPYIALAIGSCTGAVGANRLESMTWALNTLLRALRRSYGLEHISQLADKNIWIDYATRESLSQTNSYRLTVYSVITDIHLRYYLEQLDEHQRDYWKRYALPQLPTNFIKQYCVFDHRDAESQQRRKEQSDTLVPLYPLLVQIAQFRKQAAQRLLNVFCEKRKLVEAGELSLPHSFYHEDTVPLMNRDARTVSEVQIVGKPVRMHLILWNRSEWVLHHKDRYRSRETPRDAKNRLGPYSPENNAYFLQFDGPEEDFLWFGDLIKHRLMQTLNRKYGERHPEEHRERLQILEDCGGGDGFTTDRSGVLTSHTHGWLSKNWRPGDMLFEPEEIYRGILYATALATVVLTNGSRMCELLQVSDDRWDTIMVDDLKEGQATGKRETLIVQHLLPKGAQTEAQRQLFPMCKQAVKLLKEIYEGLVAAHGEVPVVFPNADISKFEHLKPERYLFQWAADPDGRHGSLSPSDVSVLLRFIFYGLKFTTAKGEPILISAHLLRHIMATYARHYQDVPPEAIALLLHHRVLPDHAGRFSIPAATAYYSRKPQNERLALLHAYHVELDDMSKNAVMHPLTERDLEQLNEDLRNVYERWGSILPTAFGYCGCPGLCVRGDQRSLCIGCTYLVVDYSKMDNALKWRNAYAQQADELEAEGNYRDAKQKRRLVQQLDDHINMMRLQQQAEADGSSLPFFNSLPSPGENGDQTHDDR